MSSKSEINEIDKQIRELEKKKSAIYRKEREDEEKARKEKCLADNKEAIEYLQKFLGKWCVFGPNAISHFYWDPFNDGHPISYDYVYLMRVSYIHYNNERSISISGSSIYTSDTGVEVDSHYQRNFSFPYIKGTYKPTDHEHYNGGLRILSKDELAKAIKFAKDYSVSFIDKIMKENAKTSFHTDIEGIYELSQTDIKELEDMAKKLKSYNESVAIGYEEFIKAKSKFLEAICKREIPFEIASKYIKSVNGFKLL